MKIISYISLALSLALPSIGFAQIVNSVQEVQEAARQHGLYAGAGNGKIDIDVVVAAMRLCQLDKSYCIAASKINYSYYANQAYNIRFAAISDKQFLVKIKNLLNENKILEKLGKNNYVYFSAIMRGSIFSNVIFENDMYYLIYNNPIIDVITIVKFVDGTPASVIFDTTDNIKLNGDQSVTPYWLRSKSGNVNQISTTLVFTRDFINSQNNNYLEKISKQASVNDEIIYSRLIDTFESSSGRNLQCASTIDQLAGKNGMLFEKYKSLRNQNVKSAYGETTSFVPSNGFELGDHSYLRIYSGIQNPEYMAIVRLDGRNCSVESIGWVHPRKGTERDIGFLVRC